MLPSNHSSSRHHQQRDSSANSTTTWQNYSTSASHNQYSNIVGGSGSSGNTNPTTTTNTASGGGVVNQDASLQLHNNLMFICQQQQQDQQTPNIAGTNTYVQHQPQQQVSYSEGESSQKGEGTKAGGGMSSFTHNGPAAPLSASDLLIEQYRQFFGTYVEGGPPSSQEEPTETNNLGQSPTSSSRGVSPSAGEGKNNSNNSSNDNDNNSNNNDNNSHPAPEYLSSSNPLYALGATVMPLMSSGNNLDDQSSPALGGPLQLSESSSDFMVKLFQHETKQQYWNSTCGTERGQSPWNQQHQPDDNGPQESHSLTQQQGESGMADRGIDLMQQPNVEPVMHLQGPATASLLKQQILEQQQGQLHQHKPRKHDLQQQVPSSSSSLGQIDPVGGIYAPYQHHEQAAMQQHLQQEWMMQHQLQQLEQQYVQLQQQQQQQQQEQQLLSSSLYQAAAPVIYVNYNTKDNQQLQQEQEQQQQQQEQQQQEQQVLMLDGSLQHPCRHQEIQIVDKGNSEGNFILPSTIVPPSVLASMFASAVPSNDSSMPKKAGKSFVKPRKRLIKMNKKHLPGDDESSAEAVEMTPQRFFCDILLTHGYDPEYRLKADDSGYDAAPSTLQLASFGTHLVKAVQTSDSASLSRLLQCGLSPNPCNQFRDSILDLVCKRANLPIFECLIAHGTDLQVVDGFGRTPLHHCCWASTFCRPIVEKIIERDPIQFFLEDKRGQTPLEYVRKDMAGEWIDFLEEVATKYWPMGGGQLPRLNSPKSRRPDGHLVDPPIALSLTLASLVSSGTITPEQIANMDDVTRRTYDN